MKTLTWKLILPLTIISFGIFTKWWYVLPVDAPDSMMAGFPFPFMCDGWHTSMSIQFFITEFWLDFAVYFCFWFFGVFCINRFWRAIGVPNILVFILYLLKTLIITGSILIVSMPEHSFKIKRDFDMEILSSGYEFIWQERDRPDLHQFKPKK